MSDSEKELANSQWMKSQGILIDLPHAELNLAFTWLRAADIDAKNDLKGRNDVVG